jgi:hypothetical protein
MTEPLGQMGRDPTRLTGDMGEMTGQMGDMARAKVACQAPPP